MTRTTRSHAGESMQDGYNTPGILLCAMGIAAVAMTLTAAGYGFEGWTVLGAVASILCWAVGLGWMTLEHRRIKVKEGRHLRDQLGH